MIAQLVFCTTKYNELQGCEVTFYDSRDAVYDSLVKTVNEFFGEVDSYGAGSYHGSYYDNDETDEEIKEKELRTMMDELERFRTGDELSTTFDFRFCEHVFDADVTFLDEIAVQTESGTQKIPLNLTSPIVQLAFCTNSDNNETEKSVMFYDSRDVACANLINIMKDRRFLDDEDDDDDDDDDDEDDEDDDEFDAMKTIKYIEEFAANKNRDTVYATVYDREFSAKITILDKIL